ncbi:DNA polymerase-3 subunit gamma/tau [Homoserinimonas aerilata]|uniref:DNA polymerase III subunit gamma/tau n=1 Tax=Homoserinimonas aerilata TaxID=1162970 RepID=A0A542YKZ5_9MICO|nr:DNA polymerase III subunit gamma and tau [Homoserinimonas aerilata]TQL48766.1 DNA polymerase-3 subunit gamma/tau [Homoserinimonas aerilata]
MVTALYRRYRPETFAELIGQSQVTEPLMTALRTNRVNHAYLFSGPRGCGKTTSARILARCLNCHEGPTDTPCGVCPSCVELSRDGGGSLDVVEIDAASHNGVDDARDLRERAVFAPARDRYKIFILDEAHMVTPQGFNALLKIVEEPPEHVKFIFATTEPDKVIGTIRSRTHHYPFRLVPPAQMLDYVGQLCESEGVTVEAGVLPLVVRAGGGSVRDTLSLLDQLIAGSEGTDVIYERAVALLGYTHGALLGEVVDALGAKDAAAAFEAVDRVIQTGQDPRRFVEDLLERLRDLIVVAAFPPGGHQGAAAVLRGVQQDELDHMAQQASRFGQAELSRTADVVGAALTEMTGATSPRLHLELMMARVLVPASDDSQRGALARVERLERRIGVSGAGSSGGAEADASAVPAVTAPQARVAETSASTSGAASAGAGLETVAPGGDPSTSGLPEGGPSTSGSVPAVPAKAAAPVGPVTVQQVRDAWPEILEHVQNAKRTAWMVLFTAQVRELRDSEVLVLSFPSQKDVEALKQAAAPGQGVGDYLKQAVSAVLGIVPKLIARVDSESAAPARPQATPAAEPATKPADATLAAASAPPVTRPAEKTADRTPDAAAPVTGWAVAQIPGSADAEPSAAEPSEPADDPLVGGPPSDDPLVEGSPSGAAVSRLAPTEPPTKASARADDEPPFDDQPPFDPDYDSVPEESAQASRPARQPRSAQPGSAQPGATQPGSAQPAQAQPTQPQPAPQKAATPPKRQPSASAPRGAAQSGGSQKYGESVVRQVLGATFIEEQPHNPRPNPGVN